MCLEIQDKPDDVLYIAEDGGWTHLSFLQSVQEALGLCTPQDKVHVSVPQHSGDAVYL